MTAIMKQLTELAQVLYEHSDGRRIEPLYPWVLVFVLPKEQKVGSIYLPDSGPGRQDKPVYEGLVLETWKPWWKTIDEATTAHPEGEYPVTVHEEKKIRVESQFEPGDHVLFPHWAGSPAGFLDEKAFRLVREVSDADPSPAIIAKVEYDVMSFRARLRSRMAEVISNPALGSEGALRQLEEEAFLVDRKRQGVTIRGI